MKKLSHSALRQELSVRMKIRSAKRHPAIFRRLIRLADQDRTPFQTVIQPWQTTDFQALDPAWLELAGRIDPREASASEPLRRAYIERPRGHSKTSDTAIQVAWILLAAVSGVRGLAAAADREQARLLADAIHKLAMANPELCRGLSFVENQVRNKTTDSRFDVISSDIKSSWGMLPDFVICDELCHWKKAELWQSLISSAAKNPRCLVIVLTNAGIGQGWQWDIREHARLSEKWHFSSLQGPQAPWITEAWLAEQKSLLPGPVFERLWLNIWQHSDGQFVTLAEAEACRDDHLSYQQEGRRHVPYVAAIDYAEKQDYSAICVCHREGDILIVDRMQAIKPTPTRRTPVQWIEDQIEEIAAAFPQVTFVVDPYQLLHTIQRFGERFDIRRFDFARETGNHRIALVLQQLILERRIRWYAGCGQAQTIDGHPLDIRDDLETELASLLLRQSVTGRFRIDHLRDGLHHDDRAFVLGVACLQLLEEAPTIATLEMSPPGLDGGFVW